MKRVTRETRAAPTRAFRVPRLFTFSFQVCSFDDTMRLLVYSNDTIDADADADAHNLHTDPEKSDRSQR